MTIEIIKTPDQSSIGTFFTNHNKISTDIKVRFDRVISGSGNCYYTVRESRDLIDNLGIPIFSQFLNLFWWPKTATIIVNSNAKDVSFYHKKPDPSNSLLRLARALDSTKIVSTITIKQLDV